MNYPENWRELLEKTNAEINLLTFESDLSQHGVEEFWQDIRKTGKEDCDGYVIGKLNVLFERGYPIEALRLATCEVPYGMNLDNPRGGHLVLDVETPEGHYVLSNGLPVMSLGAFLAKGFRPLQVQETGGKQKWVDWAS